MATRISVGKSPSPGWRADEGCTRQVTDWSGGVRCPGRTARRGSTRPAQQLEAAPGSPAPGTTTTGERPAPETRRLAARTDGRPHRSAQPAARPLGAHVGADDLNAASPAPLDTRRSQGPRAHCCRASSTRSRPPLDRPPTSTTSSGISTTSASATPATASFRLLSGALPDWAPTYAPSTEGDEAPPLSGAAETMKKVVDLAKDPAELNERFRELITTAVDEFNSGSLGQGGDRSRSRPADDLAKRGRSIACREHHRSDLRASSMRRSCESIRRERRQDAALASSAQLLPRPSRSTI